MRPIRTIFTHLSKHERIALFFFVFLLAAGAAGGITDFINTGTELAPVRGGSWAEGIVGAPSIVNPVFSSSEADQALSLLVYGSFDRLLDALEEEQGGAYVATLKENLFWSDGKPLTADDVVWTVEAIQNPDMRSPLFKNWQGIGVERLRELQVKFTLPSPYVFFKDNLRRLQIVPKHAWDGVSRDSARFSRYSLEPVGSGPFKVKRIARHQDGSVESYRLEQNPYFPGEKPYLKSFSVNFYKDERTLLKAFHAGTIYGFGSALPPDDDGSVSRGTVEKMPMSRYYAVFWNAGKNPALKDKDLRLALDRAAPRTEMKEKIFGGNATIIEGPAVYGDRLLSDARDAFDLAAAKEFFAVSDEEDTTITLTVPAAGFLTETAEILKKRWEEIGIREVAIRALSPDEVFEAVRSDDYEAILFGNILENPRDLFSFWHSSQRGYPGLNLAHYASPEADALMEEIRGTGNEETQNAKLQSLELIIAGNSPAIFLYSVPFFYVHEERLGGFDVSRVVSAPADRFRNVSEWYVIRERVIKSK